MSRKPLYLTVFVLFASTCLWSQGSIGGSPGGGVRGGGGLGAGPSSMGGGSARGSAASSRTAAAPARGSIGRSSTPARTTAGAAQASTARRATASSQASVAAGGIGTAGARGGSSVVIVPGSNSIPSLGSSIPPLQRPGSLAVADARRDSAIFDFHRGRGGFQRRGGAFHALPVIVVPYAYGSYGAYDNPNVIVVDRDTQISAEHVVTVEPQKVAQARPPVEPKVVEVEPGKAESAKEGEESQVEVLRGESRLDLQEQQTLYLVALRSGVIHTSREHWLEGDTLHFITRQGTRQTAALETVDLDFTRQLNAERGLSFVLEVRPRSER